MQLFRNFTKDQFERLLSGAAEKDLPALTLQFYWKNGTPFLDQITQLRDGAPAEVLVDAITGRARVPCALTIDEAWTQLARKLGAFNVSIVDAAGKPLGYQAIVYDGPARTTFTDKHEFVVRVDPAIVSRIDSLLPPSPLSRRARVVVYAMERLVDDLTRQLANIGHGVSRLHIEPASDLPNTQRMGLLIRCERELYDRLMRVAGGTNSAIVERALIALLHESATSSGPIVIRGPRIVRPRQQNKEDAAQQIAYAIDMAKTARAFAEQASRPETA